MTASFVYDAFGRRMEKTVGGSTTEFLYDGLNPVQELNGASPPSPTANLLTGLNIDEYFTRTASGTTSTLLADALGSTVGLVNSAGAIATNYTYEPFGKMTASGAANANPYQFTGRENDGTGLYFYRARYYSPTFQRFITQDPIEFAGGSANLFAYVLNNPTTFIDPFGYQWLPTPAPSPTPSIDQVLQDADNPLNLINPNTPTGEPAMSCAPPPPPPSSCPGGNLGVISDLDLVEASTIGGVAAGVYIGGPWGGVAGGLIGLGIGNVDLIGRAGCRSRAKSP